MLMKKVFGLVLLFIVILSLSTTMAFTQGSQSDKTPSPDYSRLLMPVSRALVQCLRPSENRAVRVDAACAGAFGPETLTVMGELAQFNNDLLARMARAQTTDVTQVAMNYADYPHYAAYLDAIQRFNDGARIDICANPGAMCPAEAAICGYYWNPVPNTAAPWLDRGYFSDPSATLTSWGYHSTPGFAGGGWTRPQTYNRALGESAADLPALFGWCGWNTFRDHAYIRDTSYIMEQDYTGAIPGEPNPEVYASGPWPYLDWPAYVYWWHQTH